VRARAAGAPVVHVQHVSAQGTRFEPGGAGRRIHARVAPRAGEAIIEKRKPDGFQGSTLEGVLRELGRTDLVLCGFATEACFDSTVRSTHARGFTLELAADGHSTTANPVLDAKSIIAHHNFVLSRFAKVKPGAEIAFA